MTLKRWDPTGTDGADVATTGSLLASVIKAGAGTMKYEADAGFSRGSEIGVEVYSGTADTDQSNGLMNAVAAAAAGTIQCYFEILSLPTPGSLTGIVPFFDIRSTTGNLIRAAVNEAGALTCQNSAGSPPGGALSGTLATLAVNTPYRLELSVLPATTATGQGQLRLYNDADVSLFSASISNGNFGTTQPSVLRFGESATTANGPTGFRAWFSQLAIDTGASIPTIAPVDKNTPPPPVEGNFPLVMVGGVWV